jgi:hypothetical protein
MVLIEAPSNDPDTFLTAVRLTFLKALRVRLGDRLLRRSDASSQQATRAAGACRKAIPHQRWNVGRRARSLEWPPLCKAIGPQGPALLDP